MVPFALFLSLLTLSVAWLNVDLWRRESLGGHAVFQGIESPRPSAARDGLDPLRAVALVGLVGLIGVTFHVWQDKVFDYSEQRVREIVQSTASVLGDQDPDAGSADLGMIQDALPDDADLDKLLILEAASSDDRTTLWQISDDDGGSPHCLRVVEPDTYADDADPEWFASDTAQLC